VAGLNLGQFIEKEIKYGEATGLKYVSSLISANESKISTALGTEATVATADLIALVEKNDSGLGPFASGAINTALTMYGPELEPIVQAEVAQGTAYLPALVTAINSQATKLEAEAAAL
jgi:hypothetical protein